MFFHNNNNKKNIAKPSAEEISKLIDYIVILEFLIKRLFVHECLV